MKFTWTHVTVVPPFYTDDLFDLTDEIERREVEQLLFERTYRFDETTFEQGSAPASLVRVVTGTTVLSRVTSASESAFVRIVRPGEILGLTETLARIPFDATLRCLTASVCQCLDHEGLVGLLRRQPRIRQRIVAVLAANYGEALARAVELRQSV